MSANDALSFFITAISDPQARKHLANYIAIVEMYIKSLHAIDSYQILQQKQKVELMNLCKKNHT